MPEISWDHPRPKRAVPFASEFRGSSPSSPLSTPQAGSDISAPTGQDSERETGRILLLYLFRQQTLVGQLLRGGDLNQALAHLELSLVIDPSRGNDSTMRHMPLEPGAISQAGGASWRRRKLS